MRSTIWLHMVAGRVYTQAMPALDASSSSAAQQASQLLLPLWLLTVVAAGLVIWMAVLRVRNGHGLSRRALWQVGDWCCGLGNGMQKAAHCSTAKQGSVL
jgi:hypothetical protein